MALQWTKEFLTEFIELYDTQKCLWNVKSKDYSNRTKKDDAYESLIHKMKQVDEQADSAAVVNSINNLRITFRRKLKKVVASKKSGARADDVYTPRL
jgi:hypothetical protein